MFDKEILKKTLWTTLLVFLAFGIIYILVWWLGFDKKFYPIEQFRNFIIPFPVSRWYDFGLICLWPLIITPFAYRGDNVPVVGVIGMILGFITIGIPLMFWSNGIWDIGGFYSAIVFLIIAWISIEIYFFVEPNIDRRTIIEASFYIYVFAGLGVALAFIFSKGLLIGLIFGFLVTISLTVLMLIYNFVFKSICRSIISRDKTVIENSH